MPCLVAYVAPDHVTRICVDTGKACSLLLKSPLAASQNFEYKMSNILDKPLEVGIYLSPAKYWLTCVFNRAYLAILACYLARSVHTVTKHSRTDRTGRGHLHRTSRARPCTGVAPMVLACLSATCTWLKTVFSASRSSPRNVRHGCKSTKCVNHNVNNVSDMGAG